MGTLHPFPLSPGPILSAVSVSADALTTDVRVKGRWSAGVLKGREKSGGRKEQGGGTERVGGEKSKIKLIRVCSRRKKEEGGM